MGTIRFALKTKNPDSDGLLRIQLIYQVKGERAFFSPPEKLKLHLKNWDTGEQKAIYIDRKTAKNYLPEVDYDVLLSTDDTNKINSKLDAFRVAIKEIEDFFIATKKIYSANDVVDELRIRFAGATKTEQPSNFIFDFMDEYIRDHKDTREPSSLKLYSSLKQHLKDFQAIKKRKITFDGVDYAFFQDFQNFLISPQMVIRNVVTDGEKTTKTVERVRLNNTTSAKYLSTVKTFLGYAKKHGIHITDNYKDFKIKKDKLEVIALTNAELMRLYKHNLANNKRLAQVRDVFCFSCFTALRYSDLAQLKRENIKKDEIKLMVKKTKELLTIPLTKYSRAILNRYKKLNNPLPVISNQKMNEYLKELGNLVKINEQIEIVRFSGTKRIANIYPKYELISVHVGRKTFCTLSLERGMSVEEVMSITGHKNYASFARYVNITEDRKRVAMGKAWAA